MSADDLTRKARFVYESLLERRIVGADTLTEYAIDIAAHVLGQADAIEARDAEIERLRSVVREVFLDGPDDHDNAKAIPYPSLSVEAADAVRRALTEGDTP